MSILLVWSTRKGEGMHWKPLRDRFGLAGAIVLLVLWGIREAIGAWGDADFLAAEGRLDWLPGVSLWLLRALLIVAAVVVLGAALVHRRRAEKPAAHVAEAPRGEELSKEAPAPSRVPLSQVSNQELAKRCTEYGAFLIDRIHHAANVRDRLARPIHNPFLGKANREELKKQREVLRKQWARNPLDNYRTYIAVHVQEHVEELQRRGLSHPGLDRIYMNPRTTTDLAQLGQHLLMVRERVGSDVAPRATPDEAPSVQEKGLDIDRTPEDLWSFFTGLTDLQAQPVIEPFIGQRILVSGPIRRIGGWKPEGFSQVRLGRDNPDDFRMIFLYFRDEAWRDRLRRLKEGDRVTVRGTLDRIHSAALELENCELVDTQ